MFICRKTCLFKHFYNCLGAGPLLRRLQCFQDPSTYTSSTKSNTEAVKAGKAKFLQQLTCMFGFKQLPWWASCVSSELARILRHEGIQVAGLMLDDLMLVTKASAAAGKADADYKLAQEIMDELGVKANNNGVINPQEQFWRDPSNNTFVKTKYIELF